MSRFAEVIVLASNEEESMEPLTRPDDSREWSGCFTDIGHGMFGGWAIEFVRRSRWIGLLEHLESLPWKSPHSVQVLVHDEEDECFGLWMIHDGRLVEVPLPRTRRAFWPSHFTGEVDPGARAVRLEHVDRALKAAVLALGDGAGAVGGCGRTPGPSSSRSFSSTAK